MKRAGGIIVAEQTTSRTSSRAPNVWNAATPPRRAKSHGTWPQTKTPPSTLAATSACASPIPSVTDRPLRIHRRPSPEPPPSPTRKQKSIAEKANALFPATTARRCV
jgi:hypothetical protein